MAQAPPKTRNLGRLTEIAQVAVRHGFGYFFERHKLTDLIPGRRNGTELLEGTASERGKHLRELLDELGPDLRQVRPAALDASGRPPAGHHRRAPRPPGRRAPVPVRGGRARRPRRPRPPDRAPLPRVRPRAARGGVDRPGAPCRAPERPRRRGQGPAPGRARADRSRPRPPLPGRAHRERARPCARLRGRARGRRRVRPRDPPGARLPARGKERGHPAPQLRRAPARARPARLLDVHARTRPDSRVHRGPPARRHRRGPLLDRGAEAPRGGDRGGLDDDGLPGRVLPRRPASGEHPRHPPGPDRARRLRARREADRRRPHESDTPVHRRREREHRRHSEAARRPRRALPEGARGRVPSRDPRPLLPVLRREAGRDRPAPGDPRSVRRHLLAEPQAADAFHHARQGDRDARVGRRRAVSRTSTSSRSRSRTRGACSSAATRRSAC